MSAWPTPVRYVLFAGVAALALLVVAAVIPAFWLFVATTGVVTAVMLLGTGVIGSAGMISLCQLSFSAVGAWVATELSLHATNPDLFYLWVVVGGLAAVPFGLVVGLPALRLRGVHLAIVTLGFAAAADVLLNSRGFPGETSGLGTTRPTAVASDANYFVFSGLVFIVLALLLYIVRRSRVCASWRLVRHSERATSAAGASVTGSKLSAFAVGAFLAGIAGALLAGQVGFLSAGSFSSLQSLTLYVVATMVGSQWVEGAVLGGILIALVPQLFQGIGISQDLGTVLFGVGGAQALANRSNFSEHVRALLRSRRTALVAAPTDVLARGPNPRAAVPAAANDRAEGQTARTVLEVDRLSVVYGEIRALDAVTLTVGEAEVLALIGPNGAGKSTWADAVTGFVHHSGTVRLNGRVLDGLAPHRRARLGLRRTFQQDRVSTALTVAEYVSFVARRKLTPELTSEVRDFLRLSDLTRPVAELDVGARRILELLAQLVAGPDVLVLDEPAAGLAEAGTVALAERLREVPARFGTSLVLIEHDLDMVRAAASRIVVLNFGEVIASGEPADVLASSEVSRAYLGNEGILA